MSFLQLLGRGLYCHPGHNMCVFMTWKRGTRPLCSLQHKKVGEHFSVPFLPFGSTFISRMAGAPSPFAGINLLVYLDFPSLMCLKWNKRPLLWPNLSQTGIVTTRYPSEQSSPKTPPTAITDSIILSKGTYSINDIYLILSSINSSKRSLKFKDYGNVTVFE